MKSFISTLMFMATLVLSCSTDKDGNENNQNAIVGVWAVTELKIDDQTAGSNAKFGKQILDYLTENNCVVLTFTFNDDLTVKADNSANYIEVNASASGLEIPCPTQLDTESSTYTYDGEILTTVDENEETVSVRANIDGNMLLINAADLDIPNFNDEGELIFVRQ